MKDFQNLTATDYLRILRRRIWYFVLTFVLVSAGTAAVVWRMPSIYKSETSILVSSRFLPEDYIGSIVRESIADRIEFAKQQLRSRTFVERIAQEFQLVPNGTNFDGFVNTVTNNIDVVILSTNSFKLGFFSTDPNTAQAVTRRLTERVIQLNDTLRKERVNVADQFLDQQVRQTADELAQVEEKIRQFNQRYFPGAPEGVNGDAFNTVQTQLAAVAADLEKDSQQRKAYERMLDEQQQLKKAVQAPTPQTRALTSPPPKPVVPTVPPPSLLEQKLDSKRTELAAAASRYTPLHPDVTRLAREMHELESQVKAEQLNKPAPVPQVPVEEPIAVKPLPEIDVSVDFYQAEIKQEIDKLDREITKKQDTKDQLSKRLTAYQRRVNVPPQVAQELSELNQQYDSVKQRYSFLATKALNSDLAGKVDTDANNVTFKVIDPANLPRIPVKPDRPILLALGCVAGFMLGFVLVFTREYLDPTLVDDEAVTAELKLPVLTSIPKVDQAKRNKKRLKKKQRKSTFNTLGLEESDMLPKADNRLRSVILDPLTVAGEQFRVMRAHLSVLQRQRGSKTILVVSAIPNEGKTFTACCLAGILAQEQGKKVLLIDADLRTSTAGLMLGLGEECSVGGLCEMLRTNLNLEDTIIDYDDFDLSFLPSGTTVENPVELLSSPRLEALLHDAKSIFDWVIVDSPPTLALADAKLLASVCDTTLLVVRAEKTPVNLIKDSIQRIGRERICGVVMNRVRSTKLSHYYNQVQRVKTKQ